MGRLAVSRAVLLNKKNMKKSLFTAVIIFSIMLTTKSQILDPARQYQLAAIGFWNVENLYDTLNDPFKNDEDFTPEGKNAWTGERYRRKLEHLSTTIAGMATEWNPDGLAILGLCEVENRKVVEDLVNTPALKPRAYRIAHIEGPDARGVDPSLIYNPRYFRCESIKTVAVRLPKDSSHKTRDILVVSGWFCGEALSVLVNHWPSRRGGEMISRANRNAAAKLARHLADSIRLVCPDSKILIMGDFNDDPVSPSIRRFFGTSSKWYQVANDGYFNPMEDPYKKGIGTLAWQDSWNLFDQIIISKTCSPIDYKTWQYYHVRIYNATFLKSDFGNFKGYPFRTYSGGVYTGGYSDHFPVYLYFAKLLSH